MSVAKILKLKLTGNLTFSKLRETSLEIHLKERSDKIAEYEKMITRKKALENSPLLILPEIYSITPEAITSEEIKKFLTHI